MTTQVEPEYDLFISYAAADGEWVEGYLLDALDAASVTYAREETFLLGVPRLIEFERSVKQSKRTLLILTPAYLADGDTQFVDLLVTTFGLETSTWPVIPLVLKAVSLPTRLAMLTHLDATNQDEWPAVVQKLCRELGKIVPSVATIPACPYPGMQPFSEEASAHFYGRETEIEEILQCLRQHPFLAVIGPSGSGKSSLVFAGLLPALRHSRLFDPTVWRVYSMRPGEQPLTTLLTTLNVANVDQFRSPSGEHSLLIIDQFEELFTQRNVEAKLFIQALQKLGKSQHCYLILTVRADFYADLMNSPLWPEIQRHRLEVAPLDDAGLRAAIVKPAETLGVYIESALIERLIANTTGQPGILPFLQEVLVLLWAKIERRFLPLHAYEALVLPYRSITGEQRTGLQVAMARKADKIFADLDDAQQRIAQRIFLRLVQFTEGRTHTRRQQLVAALRSADEDTARFEETLRYLVNNRLLTLTGSEQGLPRVDLSHEAMITGWPLLSRWIAERREAEEMRRLLEGKAAEWVRLGRGESGLLDTGEWQEAVTWLATTNARDLGSSRDLLDLVKASQAAINPGWHQWGATLVSGGFLALIALLGWGYYALRFMGAPATMTAAAVLMLMLVGLVCIFIWANARRANPYLLQKVTQFVGKRRFLGAGTGIALVVIALLWGVLGQRMAANERHCGELGFMHVPGVTNLAIQSNGFDLVKQHLFALTVARIVDYQMVVKLVNPEEIAACRGFIDVAVRLEERTSSDQHDTLYLAWVTKSADGESPEPVQSPAAADGCGAITRLATQFAQRQGYSATLEEDFVVAAPRTCTALISYEEGYRHYVRDEYTAAAAELRRALSTAPEYTLAHAVLALTLSAMGQHELAHQEIATAIGLLEKPYAPFAGYLGAICLRAQDLACAEKAYQQAIDLKPQLYLLNYYHGLINTYTESAKYEQADRLLEQLEPLLANATVSDQIRQLKQRGILAFRRGDLTAAHAALSEADKRSQETLKQLQGLLPQGLEEETLYHLALRTIQRLDEETVYYLAQIAEAQQQSEIACTWWQQYQAIPESAFFQEQERRTTAKLHIQQMKCH